VLNSPLTAGGIKAVLTARSMAAAAHGRAPNLHGRASGNGATARFTGVQIPVQMNKQGRHNGRDREELP
jgi:hypothetical protein